MYLSIGGHSFVQVYGQFTLQLLSCGFGWKYTKKQKQKKPTPVLKGNKSFDGGIVMHIFITHCSTSEVISCRLTEDQWVSMLTVSVTIY